MADSPVDFIECTSLNISYDVMGIATLSFTVVHNYYSASMLSSYKEIGPVGGQTFSGYITDAYMSAILKTDGWYETQVTLITTTN